MIEVELIPFLTVSTEKKYQLYFGLLVFFSLNTGDVGGVDNG